MSVEIRSYEDLEVWKGAVDLSVRVYEVASRLPPSEKYELSSQMRRCGVSIPSNIAEGHARRKTKPYLNHVHIALGSLAELVTCFVIAQRLGFITQAVFDEERREADRIGRMLHGLARSLERRLEQTLAGAATAVCIALGALLHFLP